ncbi:hypothetical protein LWM68_27440 [Niabella sp. W65]|nr:hypothetical protein [Niabella sp. W65]MCH7366176.1 hypothetical protein [Niabella sp. W65]
MLPGETRTITLEVNESAWRRVYGLSVTAFNTGELKLKW